MSVESMVGLEMIIKLLLSITVGVKLILDMEFLEFTAADQTDARCTGACLNLSLNGVSQCIFSLAAHARLD